MKAGLLIVSLLIITLAAVSSAEPGIEIESSYDSQGHLLTRCVTPGQPQLPKDVSLPTISSTDQEILWTVEHPTAIANNVAISGDGAFMLTGWYLNAQRTSKYAVQGTGAPIWEYPMTPNFYIPVATSHNGNVMASTGDVTPLNVWLNGAGPTPSWQFTYPSDYKGVDCDVSNNGTYVAAIADQISGDNGILFLFDPSSSTPIWQTDFNGQTQIIGVEISEDDNWILVTTYWSQYVYNLPGQSLFYTGSNYSQTMGGLDDDAEWLATGDFYGQLHVYQRTATGYTEQWSHTMGGWVTAVDISSDASTVIAGNYTYSPGNAGEVKGFDINGTLLWNYDQYGDYVADVAVCGDGSVGVAGSWGQLDATFGDVFTAFDMSTGDVIFQLLDDIDEPGSIFDVDISDDGVYAVCGGKAVHARTFGNGGEIYSIELTQPGPPDVSITMTPMNPPIHIAPGGGSFDYNVTLTNNETGPATFDAWIIVTLPGGGEVLALGPINLTRPGGSSVTRQRTQNVPGGAPAGMYTYTGYVGYYPGQIANSDFFTFQKDSVDDQAGGYVDEWTNFGESFEADLKVAAPAKFALIGNYPNPFNPATTIRYALPEADRVRLSVYDTSGRTVATLVNGWREAGDHEVSFDGSNLASGLYLYRLNAGEYSATGKMVMIK